MSDQKEGKNHNDKIKKWIKRFGVGGVIFFTVKGLAWLAVFYYGAEMIQACN